MFPLLKLPLYGLSLVCLAYLLYLARSTYLVSGTLLILFLCLAGQRRFAVTAIAGGGALLLVVLSGVSLGLLDGQKLNLDFLQEKVTALLHPLENQGTAASATIDWRLLWWKNVTATWWNDAPLFGLGFGADITSRFFADFMGYYNVSEEHLRTRSPHNVFFTVLGRLGAVGAVLFVTMCGIILKKAITAARLARHHRMEPREILFWCFVLNILFSSFFSVVLEGPTGAIPFWVMLGLNVHALAEKTAVAPASVSEEELRDALEDASGPPRRGTLPFPVPSRI